MTMGDVGMRNRKVISRRCWCQRLCHGTYVRETVDYYVPNRPCQKEKDCDRSCRARGNSNVPEPLLERESLPMADLRMAGIQLQLEHPCQGKIKHNEPVVFNRMLEKTGNVIGYKKERGEFLLKQPGLYLIHWNLAIDGCDEEAYPRFAILVNDDEFSDASLPSVQGQLTSSCYIVVKENPVVLTLTNKTTQTVHLSESSPIANLNILQIKEGCIPNTQ